MFKGIKKVEVLVDLRVIPYENWPENAKDLARQVIEQDMGKAMKEQLPGLRRDWLVQKVEALQELQKHIDDLLS